MSYRYTDSGCAYLSPCGRGEFDAAPEVRSGGVLVGGQSKREMAVGRKIQRVGCDLHSSIVTHHYRSVDRLRGDHIQRHASGLTRILKR